MKKLKIYIGSIWNNNGSYDATILQFPYSTAAKKMKKKCTFWKVNWYWSKTRTQTKTAWKRNDCEDGNAYACACACARAWAWTLCVCRYADAFAFKVVRNRGDGKLNLFKRNLLAALSLSFSADASVLCSYMFTCRERGNSASTK